MYLDFVDVSFGSKVRPKTFGCVDMGSAFLWAVVYPKMLDICFYEEHCQPVRGST